MSEKILVAVAWPYAATARHLGHIAGAYLPGDVFARYQRLKGNEVLMVSGSDEHGTAITVAAEREGITPRELVDRVHSETVDDFLKIGVSFDLFTETGTPNHYATTQDFFLRLLERGYIYRETAEAPFCPIDQRFLPDRYVEGTCPHCGYLEARGDQCDNCGKQLDPIELKDIRCRLCGTRGVEFRGTEHFFFDLAKFSVAIQEWIGTKENWRPNVIAFTLNYLKEGLHGRAITRDLTWGVPVPLPGYEEKRIYVWFDAVIGYVSATKEWAQRQGDPERWRQWWELDAEGNPPSRSYYFIAKDNITFHTINWPAQLLAYGGLALPYNVPANEYLMMEEQKISSSRGYVVSLPDFLERYDPDPLRYYLTANGPETRDTNFSWAEFYRRNNEELVANYGNLVNRVLTITYRNFEGKIPEPGPLDERDKGLLQATEQAFGNVGQALDLVRLKDALSQVMALSQDANQYISEREPWKELKTDRLRGATTLWVLLQVINSLRLLSAPFLPFSAQKLHEYLGYPGVIHTFASRVDKVIAFSGPVEVVPWKYSLLPSDQTLREPGPLFKKLDEKGIAEEIARLEEKLKNRL